MRLSVGDLIELAETGKVRNIVLDSTAQVVLHECLNMPTTKSKTAKEKQ